MPAHPLIAPALLALAPLLLLTQTPRQGAAISLAILPLLAVVQLLLMRIPHALRRDGFSAALIAASVTTCTGWLFMLQFPHSREVLDQTLPLILANAAWWQLARSDEPPLRLFGLSLLLATAPWLVVLLRTGLGALAPPGAFGAGMGRLLQSTPLQLILAACLVALGQHLRTRRNHAANPETPAA